MTPSPDEIPTASADRQNTPVDYIVVGSGPGGSPLACRLAEAGLNVLVLEAGVDSGSTELPGNVSPANARNLENERIEYYCPGLHASSTEPELYQSTDPNSPNNPPLTSWAYDAAHYSRGPRVYYPRASALGGCSAHHAMISVYGYDSDWQKIADLTGDETWLPGQMRMIYEQIERVIYPKPITRIGRLWERILDKINPGRNAPDERGEDGWLDVTTSDPNLALKDDEITSLVAAAYFNDPGLSKFQKCIRLLKLWVHGNFYHAFDLNNAAHMRQHPEGIAMVPIAVAPGHVRRGPREFLLETRRKLRAAGAQPAGKIWIATGIFVTRVLLEEGEDAPRAVGVEFKRGTQLYRPSQPSPAPAPPASEFCYCRREVILSCGAFNTPQLLMLSGIGDRAQIEKHLLDRTLGEKRPKPLKIINLPGVGKNLRDRCEISIISSTQHEFELLRGATFQPNATGDHSLSEWKATGSSGPREGIYSTNGAVLAILKRSRLDIVQPDLFILGLPVAFRGYYKGWSKDLFHASKNGTEQAHNLWTWVILKSDTK
ncbi:MAG TPA: GMC family oxidoreductase N-terminal domain-containing protein, partial [Verrucomicrobiae bacterium]